MKRGYIRTKACNKWFNCNWWNFFKKKKERLIFIYLFIFFSLLSIIVFNPSDFITCRDKSSKSVELLSSIGILSINWRIRLQFVTCVSLRAVSIRAHNIYVFEVNILLFSILFDSCIGILSFVQRREEN